MKDACLKTRSLYNSINTVNFSSTCAYGGMHNIKWGVPFCLFITVLSFYYNISMAHNIICQIYALSNIAAIQKN